MSTHLRDRAWIDVRADALIDNAQAVQASVGAGARLMPMVKADAYGLGVEPAVRALETLDPWGYGVATAEEGVELRALGVTRPVVVVSPLPPLAVEAAVNAGLQVGVSNEEGLSRLVEAANRTGREVTVHVEIDTGIGRAGFDWRRVDEWAPAVADAVEGPISWVGCYTHLHSADEGPETVHEQWTRLQAALDSLVVPEGVMVHVLNSAGALRLPAHACAVVRPGIFLYGGQAGADLSEPQAVASLRARVVHLREAEPLDTVGYGATYSAEGPEQWATLSIGYGDGLPRGLGNRGHALLSGRKAPIIGRISMDVTVVNITDIPGVSVGDMATFIGWDGDERITVDEVAAQVDSISYEVLTGFTPRLPRIWTSHDA
jgi:alanine racemase